MPLAAAESQIVLLPYPMPFRSFLILLVFSIAGCDTSESTPDITGAYEGSFEARDLSGSFDVGVTLTLEESGGVVTGTFITGTAGILLDADGSYSYPRFELTISTGDYVEATYTGTASADGATLTGVLDGPNTEEVDLVVTR